MPPNVGAFHLIFMICKYPLPHLTEVMPRPTSIYFQPASKSRNHPQSNVFLREILGKGAIRSVPPACVFPGLTIQLITFRTSCSQPAWSLFCYKSEVNRFYSSFKSVTKATVLISIINIHNSSSPAWQASWATLHKNWTLGIFMSCVLRSLVVWSWALKTCRRLTTWPLIGNWISYQNNQTHLSSLRSAYFYLQNYKILKVSLSPESCLHHILRETKHTKSSMPTRAWFLVRTSTGPVPGRL